VLNNFYFIGGSYQTPNLLILKLYDYHYIIKMISLEVELSLHLVKHRDNFTIQTILSWSSFHSPWTDDRVKTLQETSGKDELSYSVKFLYPLMN